MKHRHSWKGRLRNKCQEQWKNGIDKPAVSIKVDMVAVENTELYADVKDLVSVSLGDTVHCRKQQTRYRNRC